MGRGKPARRRKSTLVRKPRSKKKKSLKKTLSKVACKPRSKKKKSLKRTLSKVNQKFKNKNKVRTINKELKFVPSQKRFFSWPDDQFVIKTFQKSGWKFEGEVYKNGLEDYPNRLRNAIEQKRIDQDECLILCDDHDAELLSQYSMGHLMNVIPDSHKSLTKVYQQKLFNEFDWFPTCFTLPKERNKLEKFIKDSKEQIYFILKPRSSFGGFGMKVYRAGSAEFNKNIFARKSEFVMQQYMHNPYLVANRYKFHIRAYFVISNVSPLRTHLYKDGQVLFATVPFSMKKIENKFDKYAHITNFKISNEKKNKKNMCANKPGIGLGTEWTLDTLFQYLRKNEPTFSQASFWKQTTDIAKIVAEKIATCHYVKKSMKNAYMECHYELFGLDVLMDENLKIHITEANTQPGMDWMEPKLVNGKFNKHTADSNVITENVLLDLQTLIGLNDRKKTTKPWIKLF